MKLSIEQIRSITQGVDRVESDNGRVSFHRFTEREELFYKQRDAMFGRSFSYRCKAPAGVKLCFATNSKNLKITAMVDVATSRSYFSLDVFENGNLLLKDGTLYENNTPVDFANVEKIGETGMNISNVDGYAGEIKYFIDCIKNDESSDMVTPESAAATIALVERTLASLTEV